MIYEHVFIIPPKQDAILSYITGNTTCEAAQWLTLMFMLVRWGTAQ